ncbi:PA0069 family radical SAM protein [Pseudooceanicola sp. CBS1P-1]|uniref:PA0069 family radical SAM protein n=2 Tax=Paracoccaceae TaxID=31989 RepID=A0A6L7G0L7_9RHOB|nr:PA0069 family radical SAM protein [Pseudooceanicola endophyticus]MXN17489.1 PA0069 family radical SAM protein [Pseudooceanicola albus]
MSHPVEKERRKGRAAASNETGRFELHAREPVDDGWDLAEELQVLRTELREEQARSLITYNRSPDLPFDRSINPYRGCEHGCIYCFARPSHAYLGMSPGLDFETRIISRPNAAEVLAQELGRRGYAVAPLAIGTNTDPYQPVEGRCGIMRDCLEVLWEHRHPVAIVTKGTGILRDIDLLRQMAKLGLVRVGVSVTSLDPEVSRRMEPRVPAPAKRLQVIAALAREGIPVRVMVSPVVPGLTDAEVEAILAAAREAGATSASWIMLRLPREVSPLFQDWLAEHYPDRAARVMTRLREMHGGKEYDANWHRRMRGEGPYAAMIAQRFRTAARRLGLDLPQPALRCDLFKVPVRPGEQLSLF